MLQKRLTGWVVFLWVFSICFCRSRWGWCLVLFGADFGLFLELLSSLYIPRLFRVLEGV